MRPVEVAVDAALFERVVTAEVILPDSAQRSAFQQHRSEIDHGGRCSYFELHPQSEMVANRHYYLINACMTRNSPSGKPHELSSTGGPNGSFIEQQAVTSDGLYVLRVGTGMLLPDSVSPEPFDIESCLSRLNRRYEEVRNPAR